MSVMSILPRKLRRTPASEAGGMSVLGLFLPAAGTLTTQAGDLAAA